MINQTINFRAPIDDEEFDDDIEIEDDDVEEIDTDF